MSNISQKQKSKRTTVYIPTHLLEAVDKFAKNGSTPSRNELIVRGLQHMLDQLEEDAIDKEIAFMATDTEYLREAVEIAESFRPSSWEAFKLAEAQHGTSE